MKIINIFLDHKNAHLKERLNNYHHIFNIHELEIINITNKYNKIDDLTSFNTAINYQIIGLSKYNYFAINKAIKIITNSKADIILAHDKKSALLGKYLNLKLNIKIPIITICEEYINNDIISYDSLIITTRKLKTSALEYGQQPHTIYHIPNITIHNQPIIKHKNYYKTPIIGL